MITVEPHETDAWLGDTELTEEQRANFDVEVAAISERYPAADDSELRDVTLSVSLQFILGQLDLPSVAWTLQSARFREAEAFAISQQIAKMLVESGHTETAAALATGVDRMTVRKVLGKR